VNFDNGAIGLVEINTTTTRPLPRWHVDGEIGSADSPFDRSFDTGEWAKFTFAPSDGSRERQLPIAPSGLSVIDMWDRFAQACMGQGEAAVSATSVLPTMALLDAARQSSREGRSVEISFETHSS